MRVIHWTTQIIIFRVLLLVVLLGDDDDFDAKQKRFDSRNDFSQETAQSALINARKSLQDNTSDHAVQVYNILAQMGELSITKLEDASTREGEMIKKSMDDYKKKVVE